MDVVGELEQAGRHQRLDYSGWGLRRLARVDGDPERRQPRLVLLVGVRHGQGLGHGRYQQRFAPGGRRQPHDERKTPPWFDANLTDNHDGSFTFTDSRSQTKYAFDGPYRLARQTDHNGRTITYSYTGPSSHDVDTITDAQGRVTNVTHNAGGQITKIVDPAGRQYLVPFERIRRLPAP